jgi:hypothetical protein
MDCVSAPPHRQGRTHSTLLSGNPPLRRGWVKKARAPRQRHFGSRKFAVVAVDLIEKRITSEHVGYCSGTVSYGLRRFQELLSFAAKAGIPAVFVVPDERFRREFGSTRVVPSLLSSAPRAAIVTKEDSNSFSRTKLSSRLDELGADTLIIGGWDLQECILATIRGALARNYRVVTSEQICFSDVILIDRANPAGRHEDGGPISCMRRDYQRALDFYRRNPWIAYYAEFDALMAGLKRALG